MPYAAKIKNFEIGRIYKAWKDAARKDKGHWHNSYYIPIKAHGASMFTVISVNPKRGADVSHTDSWSTFVKKSLFKDITGDSGTKRKIFEIIFNEAESK